MKFGRSVSLLNRVVLAAASLMRGGSCRFRIVHLWPGECSGFLVDVSEHVAHLEVNTVGPAEGKVPLRAGVVIAHSESTIVFKEREMMLDLRCLLWTGKFRP